MLERVESKIALILLFVVSLLAFASTTTALILSFIWNYIGFLMGSTDTSYICSPYLTLKLQTNIVYNFNAIFISGCASALFQLIILAHLTFLLIKFMKSNDKYFQEFSQSMFARLYISYSLSLLGLCIDVGFYGCYIIEYGWRCLNLFFMNQLVLGSLFTVGLLSLLVCWIYLLVFWINSKNKFEQVKEESIAKSSEIDQPVNMLALFQTIKQAIKKQTLPQQNRQIKQSLLQSSLGEEQYVSQKLYEKQKLEFMTFEEFKRKEEQKHNKELLEEQIMRKLLIQEENKIKRQQQEKLQVKEKAEIKSAKISKIQIAQYSPNDVDFNSELNDSLKEESVQIEQDLNNHQVIQEQEYFPHDFVPKNEQEKKSFQKYKKKLLTKYKISQIAKNDLSPAIFLGNKSLLSRHPQNIQGGRSIRQISKYCQKNKKPVRDESIYLKKTIDKIQEEAVTKPIEQDVKEDFDQQQPQKQKQIQPLNLTIKPVLTKPIPNEQNIQRHIQQQPQKLYFHKTKKKSQSRKKLFDEQQTFLSKNLYKSILSVLVKGVEQANMKVKLKQLRQKRYQESNGKNKRSQKLIDSIRCKYS